MRSRPWTAPVFSRPRRLALLLWAAWEWLFARAFGLRDIAGDSHQVVRIGFHRWPGGEVRLRGGWVVRRGDWVGELHLNNRRFARLWEESGANPSVQISRLMGELRLALGLLAAQAEAGQLPVPAVAFYGKTLLHRGAGRLGFEVHELPPAPAHRWLARYERWLLRLYHPDGARRARVQEPLRILWMATPELVRRFGRPQKMRNDPVARETPGAGAVGATTLHRPRPPTAGPT